jgi:hypothetical protein
MRRLRGGLTPALTLTRHPSSPLAPIHGVAADVERTAAGVLRVVFVLDGDVDRLAIPAPGGSRRGERLWEHTCVELFIGVTDREAYHELNLAPSGAWQAHAFARYRQGGPLADDALAPRIAVERGSDRLVLDAEVELARLSPEYPSAPLRLGLAAVVEDTRGALSYWALAHPPGRPDFHHRDGFALTLDQPATAAKESIA